MSFLLCTLLLLTVFPGIIGSISTYTVGGKILRAGLAGFLFGFWGAVVPLLVAWYLPWLGMPLAMFLSYLFLFKRREDLLGHGGEQIDFAVLRLCGFVDVIGLIAILAKRVV